MKDLSVSIKRVDAAIQVMQEVLDHQRQLSPFAVGESLHSAINFLESYKLFVSKKK